MLEELHIRDVALIKEAWIEPGAGFTVFTGETGAGKTVLLNALKLIVGERGDFSLIRHGADNARIEAQFSGDILATRQFGVSGRNRCTLGDELVSVGRLAEVLGPSIDLHGQHDHQALLHPATHGGLLDQWAPGEIADFLATYRAALEQYRKMGIRLDELSALIDKNAEEIERGRISLGDIERIDPQWGEDDALQAMLPALQHAEELDSAIGSALHMMRSEQGALDLLDLAKDALESNAPYEPRLSEVVGVLDKALVDIGEAGMVLRDIKETISCEGGRLEEVMGRLGALDGLKRRFGPSLDNVIDRKEYLQSLISMTENRDEELASAREQFETARSNLLQAASALHDARSRVAHALTDELRKEVASLDMSSALFEVRCEHLPFEQYTAQGPDRIEFFYQPAPNAGMRPLAKIASGGEISRVMLALKSVLQDRDGACTLVFDEIDAGIGGATATLIGKRLAQLARTHQVIVVTHLAQVAVFADTHYVVAKKEKDGEVETTVTRVENVLREVEIARMLSGEASATAREHARELFANTLS